MTAQRMIEWFLLAAKAILFYLLKWLHMGTTHYNIFLAIIMTWCLGLVVVFRFLGTANRQDES